jgi:hypothetical protein
LLDLRRRAAISANDEKRSFSLSQPKFSDLAAVVDDIVFDLGHARAITNLGLDQAIKLYTLFPEIKHAAATTEDIEKQGIGRDTTVVFDFMFSDLKHAAEEGCTLSRWILDSECIHHSQMADMLPEDHPNQEVLKVLKDRAVYIDDFLGPSRPENTLRQQAESQSGKLDNFLLLAVTHHNPGYPLDISDIQFFGLCNPQTRQIIYRTRHGFKVIANSGKSLAISFFHNSVQIEVAPVHFDSITEYN